MEEKKKFDFKVWIKNPYNLALVLILIFAFGVRLYFFTQTLDQPLWWDEAEYGAGAKHWAIDLVYTINEQRPPLFQFVLSILMQLNFSEELLKFITVLLPSLFLVFAVYLLGKEMFNEKIGLIAAIFTAVNWSLLFWTSRFQPDFFSMCFQVMAVFFMWRAWKSNNSKMFILAGVFSTVGFYFKVSALLVPISFFVFMLFREKLSLFKNKNNYYFLGALILTFIPYFIWSFLSFGNPIAFAGGYSDQLVEATRHIAWYNFNFYYLLTENILFLLFVLGVIMSLGFFLYFDKFLKNKDLSLDPKFFSLIIFIMVSAFYIFYIRGTEDRWVFLWLPFIFFLSANALIFIYEKIKPYGKQIALATILILIFIICYSHLNHSNQIIDSKKESYAPVKFAGLWMKDNSNLEDKILSLSHPQNAYYSERETISYANKNESWLDEFIIKESPKYIVVSVFEQTPEWIFLWIQKNQDKLKPVQGYFADEKKTQPVLIIYEINF